MRVKKSELAGMVRQLSDINDQLSKNTKFLAEVNLAECQELAVKLGEFIEKKYKEINTEALIHQLEDYCELIYQMSLDKNQNAEMYAKLTKQVQKILSDIEAAINVDLPKDKKQIVFLPYKASMWDSLESIWMAARDDSEVDAYVIPIPYFDRNPDRSVKQWHYEGNEYPDYVPITDWQKYSIPAEKPDVIFIHNPYDQYNYVTSVHPSFYSSELKKYTDKLVYVPYFILEEINPDNQEAIDDIKHFIALPGMMYADEVIVQSENMKKIYVNEYIKFAKEFGLGGKHINREYQSMRIVGSGSPKIERLKRLSADEVELPLAWKEMIYQSNGKKKIVILYNTNLAILSYGEALFKKLDDVFKFFRQHQDDVVLWWRPHPLLESTVSSMRPNLLQEYKKYIEYFKSNSIGIYDDSSDLDRAIVCSDAYYGDGSSVANLYTAIGRPVMIQNTSIFSGDL